MAYKKMETNTTDKKPKFGWQQYGKPTPAGLSKLYDFIALFLTTVLIPAVTASEIPIAARQYIVLGAAVVAGGFLLAKQFWGVQTNKDQIPAEDVTEMKNP